VRALAAEALGQIGSDSSAAVPVLVQLLDDRAEFEVQCGCIGTVSEVRVAAMSSLGRIGQASASVLPTMSAHLNDPNMQMSTVIEAIGNIGPAAKQYLPQLLSIDTADDVSLDVYIIAAMQKIDSSHAQLDGRLHAFLNRVRTESPGTDAYWVEMHDAIDVIVQLGSRAESAKSILIEMVERDELLHPLYRAEAAYALARLEPDNSAWRSALERVSRRGTNSIFLEERIRELEAKPIKAR
jgi:HEAT repeat protein